MSIGVQSYPELYTLLLGWDLYGKLWKLLTETGLAYIPFIGMILNNVVKSYLSHAHQSAGQALRSMEIHLIGTLLIILLAVAPFISLDAHTVSYSPICGPDQGKTFHPGSTGTTYDKAFTLPEGNVRIPLWWYAVIAVSEGMTSSANTMIHCVPDLRKMVTEVNMAQLSDPEIKEELQDFQSMCYAPARAEYFNDSKSNKTSSVEHVKANIQKYGVEDIDWLGSHAFNEVYYQHLKAARPVPGVPYVAADDINADTHRSQPPSFGTPTCYMWWNSSEYGLKKRVLSALPSQFNSEFNAYIKDEKNHDSIVKQMITRTPNYANANNTIDDASYSHLIASLGIWYHQLDAYPKIYAAAQAAPIIQALLLLMVYVFLPFALVFSGYRPSAFITGAILIFSLIFWAFIWHLVSWTDKALMDALYSGWFEKQGAGAKLADMIIGSLVVVAPLFWFMFMGALGVAAGEVANTMFGLNKVADSSAQSASGGVKTGITMAAKATTIA